MFRNSAIASEPATIGDLRAYGCRGILVSCTSEWCLHSATVKADWLPDDVAVRSLCPLMVCTACGSIGADVQPDGPSEPDNPVARPTVSRPLRTHARTREMLSLSLVTLDPK
jgi:hypothetical protein